MLPRPSPQPALPVYFSPNGGVTGAVVREVSAAKTQVLVQAYSFTSAPIAKALIDVHKRGVKVLAVLDKSNETGSYHFASVKAQVEQGFEWLRVQAPADHSTVQSSHPPVCQWHGAMKESTKNKVIWYCKANIAHDSYCKARHPVKGK
jgi:phosphatidylserine/phosphatidylglycerophosphate/cardiolipin synthase-like enzyme